MNNLLENHSAAAAHHQVSSRPSRTAKNEAAKNASTDPLPHGPHLAGAVLMETGTSRPMVENPEPSRPGQLWILTIALVTYLMIILDISIVIAALPEIQGSFGLTSVQLSWIQNAYLLCFGGFLLVGARAGDAYGRRRLLLVGLAIFTFASFAIGAAPSAWIMIMARGLQGIGAAILAPAVLSLIATTFAEGPERTRALAYYSMVAGGGSSLGMVLGGILTETISWRVGFFLNVPVGIALATAVAYRLNATDKEGSGVDLAGGVTSTLGMGLLVYGIVRSAEYGWTDAGTLTSIITATGLLAAFFIRESRSHDPMVPLWLFANRQRMGAYLSRMLFVGAIVSFFFFTSQFLQGVLNFTPLQAGLGFLPVTLPTLLGAILVPRLTQRLGNSVLLCLALFLAAGGFFWLSQLNSDAIYWRHVALPMLAIGLGTGLVLGPLTVAGVAGVSNRYQGTASGIVNVAHQLGGTLGLAVLVVVFSSVQHSQADPAELLSQRIAASTQGAAIMVLGALAVALTLIIPGTRTRRTTSEPSAVAPMTGCEQRCSA